MTIPTVRPGWFADGGGSSISALPLPRDVIGFPRRVDVPLSSGGLLTVSVIAVRDGGTTPLTEGDVRFGIFAAATPATRPAPHAGRGTDQVTFVMAKPQAVALARGLVGMHGLTTGARPPSRAERGVLVAALAAVMARAGLTGQVKADEMGPLGPSGFIAELRIEIRDRASDDSGAASASPRLAVAGWILVSDATAQGRGLDPRRWFPTAVEVTVQLAQTQVPALALSSIQAGDVVVFSGWPRMGDGPHAVKLCVGSNIAQAQLSGAGDLQMIGSFQSAAEPGPAAAVAAEVRNDADGRPLHGTTTASTTAVTRVGDQATARSVVSRLELNAQVNVVAELVPMNLQGAEMTAFLAGTGLAFGPLEHLPVILKTSDGTIARGSLVDVENDLGVRVTELATASHR